MATVDLHEIEPFEICSIRPPTENYSLTFKLTRNCYWNKCAFCPVYKFGSRFSRRSLEDIVEDIRRAKRIDELIFQRGIGMPDYSTADYNRAGYIVEQIYEAKKAAGLTVDEAGEEEALSSEEMDPRLAWFRSWFREKPTIEDSVSHVLTWRMAGGETCFLGDSDGLILKREFLTSIISHVKRNFPSLARFTVYGRTKSAARLRSLADLEAFHEAGLTRVHFGLESGSDKVLSLIAKGVTSTEQIEGCLKTKEAGLACSIYVMPGLGGKALSEDHAHETARVINAIAPDFIRLRTLEVFPETPLADAVKGGTFEECDEEQVVREVGIMLREVEVPTEILSDSASNLLDLFGKLPEDRSRLLEVVDGYLFLPKREKLIFSLNSRLQSFVGQYGRLSEDLKYALTPFSRSGRIDVSLARNEDLERIIRLIRSKLMP